MLGSSMKAFCGTYEFLSLVKEATCFKNLENPSGINLILTDKHLSFQRGCAIETELSDIHIMVLTMMKTHFSKKKPSITTYRKYKNFFL